MTKDDIFTYLMQKIRDRLQLMPAAWIVLQLMPAAWIVLQLMPAAIFQFLHYIGKEYCALCILHKTVLRNLCSIPILQYCALRFIIKPTKRNAQYAGGK